MAFVTTEEEVIKFAGFTPPLVLVKGSYLSSGGGTGGVVSPGYNNSSGTLTAVTGSEAVGCRKIIADWYRPTLSDASAPGAAVAYNTTRDRDEATIVTTADTGGKYYLLCLDNGA